MTTVAAPQRAQHRGPRHVRRLPGPREGDVRRRRLPARDQRLSAVNSINWARVVAQAVYYVWAALRLGAPERAGRVLRADRQFRQRLCRPGRRRDRACRSRGWSSPPTRTTSWPASSRPAATSAARSSPTTSPSMDIQVASNFERLLLELEGGDAARARGRMQAFAQSRRASRWTPPLAVALFAGGSADQAEVARHHRRDAARHRRAGRPAYRRRPRGRPRATGRRRACRMVTLATAHPAKFPEAVEAATGDPPGAARALRRPDDAARALRSSSTTSSPPSRPRSATRLEPHERHRPRSPPSPTACASSARTCRACRPPRSASGSTSARATRRPRSTASPTCSSTWRSRARARRSARAIAEEIERVGGSLNAYTSREHTAYYARILADDVDARRRHPGRHPAALDVRSGRAREGAARRPAGDRAGQGHARRPRLRPACRTRPTPTSRWAARSSGRRRSCAAMPREALVDYMARHYGP